ncbi:MAG: hypothetical protein ACI9F9_002608 [Candidatus Paceibacteria bacterium]|jgi:hypothetical protein
MEAENLLQSLCKRHGVDPARGESLLPLIQWAQKGPPESRDRVMDVVERAIALESQGKSTDPIELSGAADQAVLGAVARILHDWAPDDSVIESGLRARHKRDEPEDLAG